MPGTKGLRATSPVHVHVDDDIPVHVHVKQPKKKKTGTTVCKKFTRSTLSSRARSKSPGTGNWVPPPAKASKGSKVSWQGPTHRLEIHTPRDTLRMEDLSTDEEDRVHNEMRQYENKIENLMSEVGTLKNEVELQKTLRDRDQTEEELNTSRRILEEQEREIYDYREDLKYTERENRILKSSMGIFQDEAEAVRLEADILSREREKLMKKLIEVEMDGQSAAKQASSLRDLIRKFRQDSRISQGDSAKLSKQKDLLLEKLADFEATNRTLRRFLREQHKQEAAAVRLGEQRDMLIKKLADTDISNERLKSELIDRDRMVAELRVQIESNREENLQLTKLQSSMEATRGHLQKELRTKEADCNRMAVQIRTLESDCAQQTIEIDHLRNLVATAKERAERDKEALKKATRVQKQKAAMSEDRAEQLAAELLEKDAKLEDVRTSLEEVSLRLEKSVKERSQSAAENTALKTRMEELESLLERVDHNSKVQIEELTSKLHSRASEASGLSLENERLKSAITTIETKFAQADEELMQLRSNLKHYENLVDEYKTQMNRSRRDVEDTESELHETRRDNERLKLDSNSELEKVLYARLKKKQPSTYTQVKSQLQDRLQELQPLPEMLKNTELKLHESEEQLRSSERRSSENAQMVAELNLKVSALTEQMEKMQERLRGTQTENHSIGERYTTLERRLQEAEDQNRELLTTVARREEALHQNNLRLEDRERENASLTRQLENSLTDIRRQQDTNRDKQAAKERTLQTRIVDLESTLSQTRAEVARIKREKEETERKFNSRLYDLKDRLEQSHSTNRSMQNYVQFLKNSYANVFGDSSVNMMPATPMRQGFP
ncbi:outer dense fiber protein 2-like isoform X2 [Mya arenaria]|uniref:outer dense fiber protein 2-like isoform X2 n=1 Tax=Mya arenaria TaxID=6604 RepID=UPI0022E89712|nr:outer dense fiber protein 2-like isoform X2 [Mya arenaria]